MDNRRRAAALAAFAGSIAAFTGSGVALSHSSHPPTGWFYAGLAVGILIAVALVLAVKRGIIRTRPS